MAKAYTELGADAVKGLASALLAASQDSSKNKRVNDTLLVAVNSPEVVALALAAVADMRTRLGAEPSEWAKEHLAAQIGQTAAEKLCAEFGYSQTIKTLAPLLTSNEDRPL